MRFSLTRAIPLLLLGLTPTLTACSGAASIHAVETELPKLAAQDNRECKPLSGAPASARTEGGVYHLKPIILYIDTIRGEYRDCSDLQARNLTVLRGERKK